MDNNKELNDLEYQDLLVDLAMTFTKNGVHRVLLDFQTHYPDFFQEIKVQVNRLPDKPIAALLRK